VSSIGGIAAKLPATSMVRSLGAGGSGHKNSSALADRPVLLLVTWLPGSRFVSGMMGSNSRMQQDREEWSAASALPGEFEGKLALAQHRKAIAAQMPHRAKLLAKLPRDLDPRSIWRKLKQVAGYGITRITVDIVGFASDGTDRSQLHLEPTQSMAFRVPFGKTIADLRRAISLSLEKQKAVSDRGGQDQYSIVGSSTSGQQERIGGGTVRVILYRLKAIRRLPSRPHKIVTLHSDG